MKKPKKIRIIGLVILALFSYVVLAKHFKDVDAIDEATTTTEIKPYAEPTGDVRKFLGIWMSSGYSLQPKPNNYVLVNKPITLYTDQGRSLITRLATLFLSSKYQWFETTDGKKWSKISRKNGGEKKNLTVTPNTVGTKYYQQRTAWYVQLFGSDPAIWDPKIFSHVAAVHTLATPVDAESLEVTTDDDYLYNVANEVVVNQTYARAEPTPANFTGTITWSVDNTNLATIDKDTGLITANTDGRSGPVKVIATVNNPSGNDFSEHTFITVGGGLEDQTVKAGKTATFDLQGNIGELDDDDGEGNTSDYTVQWYKKNPITNVETKLDVNPQSVSYTTPETTLDDDGTLFRAVIKVNYGNKPYIYKTNEAMLYVTPEGGPNLEMTNKLTNETYNDGSNTDTMLFDVVNNDVIDHSDTVTNKSTSGTLSNATYVLPLHNNTRVISIKVDGQEIDADKYKVNANKQTNNINLLIPDLNFKINESHKIEVSTIVADITAKESFQSIPYIYGKDDDGDKYQKVGRDEIINYSMNNIKTETKPINYGTINTISANPKIARQSELNLPNNVIDIDDTRRNKTPVTVTLSQNGEFTEEKTGSILSGHLRYYKDDDSKNLLTEPTVIKQTKQDEALQSIGWDKDNGVLLYMESKWNSAGTYKTVLDWTIQDSI